ncbi:hypothetical protein CA265_20235 [Sphingobacteriaceae bacterium GW460-11-11-14-LB5]|nr:hypothetical protein CA265_20235 [Sphingobacteriaceae bacterium GW460-11-11-14-LB5]
MVNQVRIAQGHSITSSPEALAYLLSYEANEEARLDTKKAIKLATLSLWISATLAVISIVVSIYFGLK